MDTTQIGYCYSRAAMGLDAHLVRIETHIGPGLPAFHIVGLPEMAVREAKERIRAAVQTCELSWPKRKIIVNLSPADLPKQGARFDLPIFISICIAQQLLPSHFFDSYEWYGEIGLDGQVVAVRQLFSSVVATCRAGRTAIVPKENSPLFDHLSPGHILLLTHIKEIFSWIETNQPLDSLAQSDYQLCQNLSSPISYIPDNSSHFQAMLIAAAGGHHSLLIGPPGAGKTSLVSFLPSILPPLARDEALTLRSLYELADLPPVVGLRPFRNPHHHISLAGLVGGGSPPNPGEISLAHHGILFLDEAAQFSQLCLDALRVPIETGTVTISRSQYKVAFPSRFQLILAMNPCPCGWYGYPECHCSEREHQHYWRRLSGPLLDRIDLHIMVAKQPWSFSNNQCLSATDLTNLQQKLVATRAEMYQRWGKLSSALHLSELPHLCPLSAKAEMLLAQAIEKWRLSKRVIQHLWRISATVACWQQQTGIDEQHMSQSIMWRQQALSPATDI